LTEKERSCQRYRITLSREITLLTFYINDLWFCCKPNAEVFLSSLICVISYRL
jgi:hypothetical protein